MNNNLEKEIFKKATINLEKLKDYGFKKVKDDYIYIKFILNKTFKIEIIIHNNIINGKIFDLKMNDLYTNFRTNSTGDFVNKIRKEYINLLKDIRDNCCDISYFKGVQANKMSNYIIDNYQDYPEFMWEKYPGYGVFKNKVNKKWYAVILDINKSKLDNEDKEIEIINLKVNPKEIDELLKRKNYYEGYHMNKKNWISIILDEGINNKEIQTLIDNAYRLIEKSGK